MALPEEYRDVGPGDLRMRIGQSIIEYNGEPIYICNVTARRSGAATIHATGPNLSVIEIDSGDEGLSVRNIGQRFGIMDDQKGVVRFARVPRRAYCQGINGNNTAIGIYANIEGELRRCAVNENYSRLYNDPRYTHLNSNENGRRGVRAVSEFCHHRDANELLVYLLSRPSFLNMWHNTYPTLEEVLSRRPGAHALSRRYFVNTLQGDNHLLRFGGPVGTIVDGRVQYLPSKQFLIQDVERTTGLRSL